MLGWQFLIIVYNVLDCSLLSYPDYFPLILMFQVLIVGGSFGLREFAQIRYDIQKVRGKVSRILLLVKYKIQEYQPIFKGKDKLIIDSVFTSQTQIAKILKFSSHTNLQDSNHFPVLSIVSFLPIFKAQENSMLTTKPIHSFNQSVNLHPILCPKDRL